MNEPTNISDAANRLDSWMTGGTEDADGQVDADLRVVIDAARVLDGIRSNRNGTGYWDERWDRHEDVCRCGVVGPASLPCNGAPGMCPAVYPDPNDPVRCWLLAGHTGQHNVDGGTYLWCSAHGEANCDADICD